MAELMETIAETEEPQVATVKGGERAFVPFWVVKAGDALYARSHLGKAGRWYQEATRAGSTQLRVGDRLVDVDVEPVGDEYRAEIDAAYRMKYGHGPTEQFVAPMLEDDVVATTVRLKPRG